MGKGCTKDRKVSCEILIGAIENKMNTTTGKEQRYESVSFNTGETPDICEGCYCDPCECLEDDCPCDVEYEN